MYGSTNDLKIYPRDQGVGIQTRFKNNNGKIDYHRA